MASYFWVQCLCTMIYRWVSAKSRNSNFNALGLRFSCTNPYMFIKQCNVYASSFIHTLLQKHHMNSSKAKQDAWLMDFTHKDYLPFTWKYHSQVASISAQPCTTLSVRSFSIYLMSGNVLSCLYRQLKLQRTTWTVYLFMSTKGSAQKVKQLHKTTSPYVFKPCNRNIFVWKQHVILLAYAVITTDLMTHTSLSTCIRFRSVRNNISGLNVYPHFYLFVLFRFIYLTLLVIYTSPCVLSL